jgi:hypothetical protein
MRSEGRSIVRRGRRDVRDCSIERFISGRSLGFRGRRITYSWAITKYRTDELLWNGEAGGDNEPRSTWMLQG